jgi:hypothetical protein
MLTLKCGSHRLRLGSLSSIDDRYARSIFHISTNTTLIWQFHDRQFAD